MIISSLFSLVLIVGLTDSPRPTASVGAVEGVECMPASAAIKVNLHIELSNQSQGALLLGRVSVAKERFYRLDSNGTPVVIDTSFGPDLVVGQDMFDSFDDIKEERLAAGVTKTFTFSHIILLMPQEVILHGAAREILVSFDIANVEKSGHASEYWTAPVSIGIPKNCTLQ
jgi:hypothetical protein